MYDKVKTQVEMTSLDQYQSCFVNQNNGTFIIQH